MKKLLTWLSKRRHQYDPLITVELSKTRLLNNLYQFHSMIPDAFIAPVLKSNAYGHGLFEIASMLEKGTKSNKSITPFYIVDSYFEAIALRNQGIKTPLLIIGYTRPETITTSRLKGISFSVTTLDTLHEMSTLSKPVLIHLKIDTGMRRQGILSTEIPEAISLIQKNPAIVLEGICSHLSDANNSDPAFTQKQITSWNGIAGTFKTAFPSLKYIHLSATDGHLFHSGIDANVSRLGIGLYGVTSTDPLINALDLYPVMEIKTIITGVKSVKKGETIGYGNTFTAYKDMLVATIPFGYFEGLDRRLSNSGFVLVGDRRVPCPIVGRVSMNITTIDVTNVDAHTNTPVVVISNNPGDPNSITEIVKVSEGTIPYEMVVKIPQHLKRVVVD